MASSELKAWPGQRKCLSVEYDLCPLTSRMLPTGHSTGVFSSGNMFDDGIRIEYIEEDSRQTATSHDAAIDYGLAAVCGVLSGALDSFFTGAFSLDRSNEWGAERINSIVLRVAKLDGYKGESLKGAIKYMEDHYPFVGDRLTAQFGGGRQHHLRDFSHHFSLGGLIFSILTQFTGLAFGTNQHGDFVMFKVPDTELIGKNPAEKLVFGTLGWLMHMVSDMAGSSSNPGAGAGIPGPIMSLIKELSSLPVFKDAMSKGTGLRLWMSKLFNGTLLKTMGKDGKTTPRRFNLRTEIGMVHELGRQAFPVLINECLTRACYFAHHLYMEARASNITSINEFNKIDADRILPFNNHRVVRMVTIASGTFTVIDLSDAAIRAVVMSKGTAASLVDFALRVNYVGLIRFTFAVRVDIGMVMAERQRSSKQSDADQTVCGEMEHERDLVGFEPLVLTQAQVEVLLSMERQAIYMDIEHTRKLDDRQAKEEWLAQWTAMVSNGREMLNQGQIVQRVGELGGQDDATWLQLMAMEMSQFSPYQSLREVSSRKWKKLKFDRNYFDEMLRIAAPELGDHACSRMGKAFDKNRSIIDGSSTRNKAYAAGAAVAVAGTAGTAAFLAPVIAPVVAGYTAATTVTGLSGAALTSASLAALGGGALTAGGFGMAGGTAVIAGGGALLGLTGSGGVAAIATLMTDDSDAYTLQECAKLLTFSCETLIGLSDGEETVERLRQQLAVQIDRINDQRSILSALVTTDANVNGTDRYGSDANEEDTITAEILEDVNNDCDSNDRKNEAKAEHKRIKRDIALLDKSLKYMRRTEKQLTKLVTKQRKANNDTHKTQQLSNCPEI